MAQQGAGERKGIESRYTRRGQLFIVAATAGFVVLETVKEGLFPQLTKWESHVTSIVFMATVSALAVLYLSRILGTHERDTARIRSENMEHRLAEASAQASEEHVRRLLEQTSAIPWEADAETWMFQYVGPQALTVLGYPLEDWYEEGFWEAHLHPEDRDYAMGFCAEASQHSERFEFEYRMLSTKGEVVWLYDLVSVEFEDGKPKTLQGFMLDITDRKRAEEELAERLAFEKLVSELSTSLIGVPGDRLDRTLDEVLRRIGQYMGVDRCGIGQFSDDKMQAWMDHQWNADGVSRSGGARGDEFQVPDPYDGRGAHDLSPWFARRVLTGEAFSFNSVSELPPEADRELANAERFGIRSAVVIPLIVGEDLVAAFSVHMVRAERSWSEEDVRRLQLVGEIIVNALLRKRSEEALQRVSGRLIQSQEDERTRIARELHDDVGQRLALLSLDLHSLGSSPGDPDEVQRRTAELAGQVTELSGDVQSVAYNLHPAQLEHLGLGPAVESLCRELITGYGLRIELDLHELPELPDNVALYLYRITQEALQNVFKHSGAIEARVELWEDEDEIILRISDTGSGFDPAVPNNNGLGLVSMRERLRLIGGHISIESSPGAGTRLEVQVPISEDAG